LRVSRRADPVSGLSGKQKAAEAALLSILWLLARVSRWMEVS